MSNETKVRTRYKDVKVTIEWSEEDRAFVARTNLAGVVSHGPNISGAADAIEEAIELHLESIDTKYGTLLPPSLGE